LGYSGVQFSSVEKCIAKIIYNYVRSSQESALAVLRMKCTQRFSYIFFMSRFYVLTLFCQMLFCHIFLGIFKITAKTLVVDAAAVLFVDVAFI